MVVRQYKRFPLHAAAAQGQVAMVEALLNMGAEVDVQDMVSGFVLHSQPRGLLVASHEAGRWVGSAMPYRELKRSFGRGEVCKKSAPLSRAVQMGRTPLHLAVHALRNEVVPILLNCGADYTKRDNVRYFTPRLSL